MPHSYILFTLHKTVKGLDITQCNNRGPSLDTDLASVVDDTIHFKIHCSAEVSFFAVARILTGNFLSLNGDTDVVATKTT